MVLSDKFYAAFATVAYAAFTGTQTSQYLSCKFPTCYNMALMVSAWMNEWLREEEEIFLDREY